MCRSPLSSTVVGSYPQPEWLIDRDALGSHSVPRVRVSQEAQDDATMVASRRATRPTTQQISIEAAQPRLDLGQLAELSPKVVVLGVLDLGDDRVETPEQVAARIRAALAQVPAERLVPAPDCGMKYLPRARAFGKLKALADGAALVRAEL